MKLYHNTPTNNLPSICKRGLRPHRCKSEYGAKWGRVVWLTTVGPCPGEGRMLTIEIDRNDPRLELAERLKPGAEWWVYRGTIPPDQLSFTKSLTLVEGWL